MEICRDHHPWWSMYAKKNDKSRQRPGPPVDDGLVQRDFTADGGNELWMTDITEHRTDERKLYLCAIKDVFSSRLAGYLISDPVKARLAVNALDSAISWRREGARCSVCSDDGSQFLSQKFVQALSRPHLIKSMGKFGAVGDNAAVESLFALLQKIVLDRARLMTRDELRIVIISWIERIYERRR